MVNSSIVSLFDRMSIRTVLTKNTGSYLGFLCTLIFIAICIILLVPVIYAFHNGVYFQSLFLTDELPRQTYYSGEDYILAIAFRNRITNQFANHSQILQNIKAQASYYSMVDIFKTPMQMCKPQIFKNAINPIQVKDCLMLPSGLSYNIKPDFKYFNYIDMSFTVRCQDALNCGQNKQKINRYAYLKDLNDKYYYEYIFTSKVLDDKGNPAFQFHKLYSSEYNSPDTNVTIAIVKGLQMKSFVDNSIMPWWNNKTVQGPIWNGNTISFDLTDGRLAKFGFYADYYIFQQVQYAFRYYKKLDFLLGTIGGTIFLLFLLFWIPINFLNRTWQKIHNAQSLLIDTDYYDQEQNNKKQQFKSISFRRIHINIIKYLFNCIKPGNSKQQDLVNLGQHQVDIVKMIKKLKVTKRNLRITNIQLKINSKDLQLQGQQQSNKNQIDDKVLDINPQIDQILIKAQNTQNIYSANPTPLALISNKSSQKVIINDANEKLYKKQKSQNCCENFKDKLSKVIRFFDIFGVRPMFMAEPQNSSLWGLILTLIILILSILTFALTLSNMNSTKIMINNIYQQPQNHGYDMITGNNIRYSFCLPAGNVDRYFLGSGQIAKLTFFKYTKSGGFQQVQTQRMERGQLFTYYQVNTDQMQGFRPNQRDCFRPVDNVKIKMGGSFGTSNQAYFGMRVDPYCGGTPLQCQINKATTIKNFLQVINGLNYNVQINQNTYSPTKGRIVPRVSANTVSQKESFMNANLKRTQSIYLHSTQVIQDKSKSFLRQNPKTIFKSASANFLGFKGQQRKGDPNSDPAYILEIRPNGRVQQVILRSYKIDFLLGLIGGVFLFWYLIVHFFAKVYNSYKVRAKLAQVLYQQGGGSFKSQLLYMLKVPTTILCCSGIKSDVQRIKIVDQKIKRDLNYLNIVKKTDNIYYLSCSLFSNNQQKNLSSIYFRQRICYSEEVKTRKQQYIRDSISSQMSITDYDSLRTFDDHLDSSQKNQNNNILRQNKVAKNTDQVKKIVSQQKLIIEEENDMFQKQNESFPVEPLNNWNDNVQKESTLAQIIKNLDVFKNRPEYTLNGKRDIKSICGGLCFFLILILIIIVCAHFVGNYLSGADFTISYRKFREQYINKIDQSSTYNDQSNGINIVTGKNFKFGLGFYQRQHYYPHDVSSKIGGAIGVRVMQYTNKRINNAYYNETFVQTQLKPCKSSYLKDFMGDYDDPQIFTNLTYGYCIPDEIKLTISGLPQDNERKYFKISIYNKYKNQTGKAALNQFLSLYSVIYYNTIPIIDFQKEQFDFELFSFVTENAPRPTGIQYNFTFSKMVYTNKYSKNSLQAYSDRVPKFQSRKDLNILSDQSTRNLTFTYNGLVQQYTLDYPQGGQLFGLVGGVIALFTFIIYCFVHSFNQYRMKYLIGKQLYSFYIKQNQQQRKNQKKQILNDDQKFSRDEQQLQKANNFNQLYLFFAWILTPIAYIKNDYNFNENLRKITLIIQRVQNDLNLYNYLLTLHSASDALNQRILLKQVNKQHNKIKLSQVYFKKIYHPYQNRNSEIKVGSLLQKIKEENRLSTYQIINIQKAINSRVNSQAVLGNNILQKVFKQGKNVDLNRSDKFSNTYNRKSDSKIKNKNDKNMYSHPSISNFEQIQQSQKNFNTNQNVSQNL